LVGSRVSGRFQSAEPGLYLRVERGATKSTCSDSILEKFFLKILVPCRQFFNSIRERLPQQYRSHDDEKQGPEGCQHLKQTVQKALVIQSIGLRSVRGRQRDGGEQAKRFSGGNADEVSQLACLPGQVPAKNMKPQPDQNSSRD
jgi:hypothetical protein